MPKYPRMIWRCEITITEELLEQVTVQMNEPPTPPPEGGVGVKPRYQILTACDALQWVVERLY